jgi:hypothetical protein
LAWVRSRPYHDPDGGNEAGSADSHIELRTAVRRRLPRVSQRMKLTSPDVVGSHSGGHGGSDPFVCILKDQASTGVHAEEFSRE